MTIDDLTKVKVLLSIKDSNQDDLLNLLLEDNEARLLSYINQDGNTSVKFPTELAWLLREITVRRFNRIGDEGKKSSSESDVSATWSDDDVQDFAVYLNKYRQRKGGRGTARFI
ncbi:phage head-tail connector protein [Periweissella ghanensis]|uniref:Phage head-tail connector protein n=1 Tax=Periweissella ghanensis TaxID=467997 RepID=A0ABM8ZDL4_9LACO|nr:phage head-tail connector protein [Periweissella ghanensis]MCM0600358.1 phage head-tail connector protein [Periweissella ghanensis]CAH0419275.1 hypothetical protein WGH24286_01723 [Periweissella ghanensis]